MSLNYTFQGVPLDNVIYRDPAPVTREGQEMYERMICDTLEASPPTPDLNESPDMEFFREVNHTDLSVTMPDGVRCSVWVFEDTADPNPDTALQFPSKLLRFQEGKVVHSHLKVRHGSHTIHHHGLEPETINDGVGHISMEVGTRYTYQITLREGSAGTYFYHCHRNTPLHFEMGMYGGLIVDPPEGPGRLFSGGPQYDREAFWATDDISPQWRSMTSPEGAPDGTPENKWGMDCASPAVAWYGSMDPEISNLTPFNPGMSLIDPKYFVISGIPAPLPPDDPVITHPKVAVTCAGGDHVLIRLLNAAYNVAHYTFGIDVQVVGMDGRPLGTGCGGPAHHHTRYSRPYTIPAGTPFYLTTARRMDLLVRPRRMGVYPFRAEFRDWIDGQVRGVAATTITATSSAPFVVPSNLLLGD